MTIKYSLAGTRLWVARYNGPANSADEASALAMDGSGNFLILRRGGEQAVYIVSAGNLGWDDAVKISETMLGFLQDAQPPSDYLHER